jgi:putative phosphoribosyl transferase
VPGQRELAFGAIGPGGVAVFNERLLDQLHLGAEAIGRVIESEADELERREQKYRGGRAATDLQGKTVIIVDDGLATGATMRAAVESVRRQAPARIIVAAPVASPDVCAAFELEPDVTCVCAATPEPLYGVGWWYEDFEQTSDETVCRLLEEFQPAVASNGS